MVFLLGLGIFLIAASFVFVLVGGRHVFTLKNSQNILFITGDLDSNKGKIYLGYFFPKTQEIELYQLKDNPKLSLENLTELSWQSGVIVDRVIQLDDQNLLKNGLSEKRQLQQILLSEVRQQLRFPLHYSELSRSLELYFFTRFVPLEQQSFSQEPVFWEELRVLENVALYEECQVAVVNTTQVQGLATKFSQILEKNGAVPIKITDQEELYLKSLLVYDHKKMACQNLVERLESLFPELETKDESPLQTQYRSNLVVFLGEDVANW